MPRRVRVRIVIWVAARVTVAANVDWVKTMTLHIKRSGRFDEIRV